MWDELHDPPARRAALCRRPVLLEGGGGSGRAAGEGFADNWRTVDYVVTTPQLVYDTVHNDFPIVTPALEHSRPVAAFNTGGWQVEVRRVDPRRAGRAPAVTRSYARRPAMHDLHMRKEILDEKPPTEPTARRAGSRARGGCAHSPASARHPPRQRHPATYLYKLGHTGYEPQRKGDQPRQRRLLAPKWIAQANETISDEAIAANGLIYWGSWDGLEHATDPETGVDVWTANLGEETKEDCNPPTSAWQAPRP